MKRIISWLNGLLVTATASAQPAQLPVTAPIDPAQLTAVYNTGDSSRYTKYVAGLTADPARITANSQRMQREFAHTGPVRLMKTTVLSPTQTELTLKTDAYDSWWKLIVFTDSVNTFQEHRMRPVRLTDELLSGEKRTQAQVIAGADQYISKLVAKGVFAGNVLIARNNEVLYAKSFGHNPQGQPNLESQSFHLASLGKLFTSISVLQLVDAGKLSLDDRVGRWMPELTNQALHAITIRQLLTHSSGMGDFFEDPAYAPEPGRVITRENFVAAIEKDRLHFAPGQAFRYSNTGYLLLGLVVEKVTRSRFADYVTKHILQPVSMTHTQIGSGAGGGFSTLTDVYQFSQAIRQGTLLKQATSETFLTYHTPDWGLGQEYQALGGEVITGHSGGYIGVCTELNMYQNSGYTVIILSNSEPPYGHFLADKIKELTLSK